jgi:hypothetical protein
MRHYPQLAPLRSRQIARDVLVGLTLLLFAGLAWAVRSTVMTLTVISEGFTSSAAGAEERWQGVGDVLARVPLLGEQVGKAFEGLGSATFGNAAESGKAVTDAVTTAANVLALVTFAAPAAVLLVLWLPRRLDRARTWDAGYRVLGPASARGLGPADAEGLPGVPAPQVGAGLPLDHVLAMRALCHLPLAELARVTPRPFEAFAAGDYAPLVAALYAHEGVLPPTPARG